MGTRYPITAKYASTCPSCNGAIEVGDRVLWARGEKATHVVCPKSTSWVTQQQAPVARIAPEAQGVYVIEGDDESQIVKVQATRDGQRTYAMRWEDRNAARLMGNGEHAHGEWVYEPGLVTVVAREGHKMTLDEARAFIVLYGQCVRCGRHLKAAESVERGIGPVCVKYFEAGTTGASVIAA